MICYDFHTSGFISNSNSRVIRSNSMAFNPTNYDDPIFHCRRYSPEELENPELRAKILSEAPDTRFDPENMTEDNISSFWYKGIPDSDFPRYWSLLMQRNAGLTFDQEGSFVKKCKERPVPLFLVMADRFRKAEYKRLIGEAVSNAQQVHPFNTTTWYEPKEVEAAQVLSETVTAFKDRIGPDYARFLPY